MKPKRTIVRFKHFLWLLSFVILQFATCDYFGNGRYGNLVSELMLITVFRLFAICGFLERLLSEWGCGSFRFVNTTTNGRADNERTICCLTPENKEPNANATANKNYSNKFPFLSSTSFSLFFFLKTKRDETK